MIDNISLLVAIKNNLDYTKNFYETTRQIYPDVEICFVSYGSTDGTHNWLEQIKKHDSYVKVSYDDCEFKSFSDTYNKCAEIATKDYVVFVHNDMVLYNGFLENIYKHLSPDTIVGYTTIEPPIFKDHARPGKETYDCGSNLNTFLKDKLFEHCSLLIQKNENRTENDISFFMCLYRKLFLDIGGFDNLFFPFFREDDDLIKRLKMLDNKRFLTAKDALCYHFVSKTSRYSDQYKSNSSSIELNSLRNYIRKWGSVQHAVTYHTTLVIKNVTNEALYALEPYGQEIYLKSDGTINIDELIKQYINQEQKNTSLSLSKKIHNINKFNPNACKNICIIDCNKFDQNDLLNIENIQNIIHIINRPYLDMVHNLILMINSLEPIHKNKIHNNKKYSINQYLDDLQPKRWDIINHLIKSRKYKKYLEIGVNNGECIKKINAEIKDGVDPGAETFNPPEVNYPISSDTFFESIDETTKYDLIFIDGLHHHDQVDKDINNALNHLNDDGIIVLHDCNPPEYELQTVPRKTGLWNGDVWKSIVRLRCDREDLCVSVIDTDWGVGLVHKGTQKLYDGLSYDSIIDNWHYFDKNRTDILNIISVDEFYNLYN